MTPRTEAGLLLAAAGLAGVGTALVTATAGDSITVDALAAFATILGAFGSLAFARRMWASQSTRLLLPPVAFLTAIGGIEVFRIDRDLGRLQRWWLVLAAALAIAVLGLLRRRGLEVLRRFRYLFLAGSLALLLLPLLPSSLPLGGATVNGSRLWVRLDFGDRTLSLQPGEAAKLLLVIFFASYLAERRQALRTIPRSLGPLRIPEPRQLVPILLAFAVSFAVLVYQRDLGASLLLFGVFVTMLFAATSRPTYLVAGGALAVAGSFSAFSAFSHVQARVDSWLRPFEDFASNGYQAAQGLFALADGGLTGTGIGNGLPYLIPAAATDFIFVAIAEELGLAGAVAVLAAFGLIVATGFGIALRAHDEFRSLLAAGLTLVLAIQTLLILAGVLRVLPLTGITLPFVSYGGSSLLANLMLVALLIRVSHEERI